MLLNKHITPWLQVNPHVDRLLARLKPRRATETQEAAAPADAVPRHSHEPVSRLGCDNGMIQIWTILETPHGAVEQRFIGW